MDMSRKGRVHAYELGGEALRLAENSDEPNAQAGRDRGRLPVIAVKRMQQ